MIVATYFSWYFYWMNSLELIFEIRFRKRRNFYEDYFKTWNFPNKFTKNAHMLRDMLFFVNILHIICDNIQQYLAVNDVEKSV